MSFFNNYDPNKTLLFFKGVPITGFTDGTFITVKMAKDDYSLRVGAGGDQARVKSNDRSGTMEVTLLFNQPANAFLAALRQTEYELGLDADGEFDYGELILVDLSTGSEFHAPNAWIQRMPDLEYSNEATDRVWTFQFGEATLVTMAAKSAAGLRGVDTAKRFFQS